MQQKKTLRRPLEISSIIVVSVILDQVTKWLAIGSLKGNAPLAYLGNFFRLEYAENSGAFLSLGARLPEQVRFWILTVMVGIFLVVCLGYLISNRNLNHLSTVALSLVAGGGISNFLDRLLRDNGRVVDFMNMGVGNLRTGIFNVADVAIMVGVGLLTFQIAMEPSEEAAARNARPVKSR